MAHSLVEVESYKLFSESLLWQLNRDYYQEAGISAWSQDVVPHHMTSNSMVGKTYAELILGLLKDIALQGRVEEKVYIVELGAGHGRLAFHILRHLDILLSRLDTLLPPYCMVISDIVEENLLFFKDHQQLLPYYEAGKLDYAYYDAVNGEELNLLYSCKRIKAGHLGQPIVAIGNYFFDSIPTDIFKVKNGQLSVCSVALHTPQELGADQKPLLKNLKLSFEEKVVAEPFYESDDVNSILASYTSSLVETYFFFPELSLRCLKNLKALSSGGLMLLSIDKGYRDIRDLDHKGEPEIITHGSFSIWVNFHALSAYCERLEGRALFPQYSTFHLKMGCLLFLDQSQSWGHIDEAYQQHINDFGPDDFNSIKHLIYGNIRSLSLIQIIALLRLNAYDSTLFVKMLPRIKQVIKEVTHEQRDRIAQTLDEVWRFYFDINEAHDLALTIAGIYFDLGYYEKAIEYFNNSTATRGQEEDTHYNKILCYYQLRQDVRFSSSLKEAKLLFPSSSLFDRLDKLDLSAE